MRITPEALLVLINEVELEDPIDFSDLPFSEVGIRELIASQICEMAHSMEHFSLEDRYVTLLASTAKMVLENMVLQTRLMIRDGLPIDDNVQALLSRLSRKNS